MENSLKYEFLNTLTGKIYEATRSDLNDKYFEIQRILFDEFKKYLIVDEEALRNNLKMVHIKNDKYAEEFNSERYEMGMYSTTLVPREELNINRELVEKYLEENLKDLFCSSLDSDINR